MSLLITGRYAQENYWLEGAKKSEKTILFLFENVPYRFEEQQETVANLNKYHNSRKRLFNCLMISGE